MSETATNRKTPGYGPNAPRGLNDNAKKVWQSVVREYELAEWQLSLLKSAVQLITKADEAKEVLDREGMTYENRFGDPTTRPEYAIWRQCIAQKVQIFQKLYLDPGDDDDLP